MTLGLIVIYGLVYLAGYYGAHLLILALRRVLVRNLRVAGLALLALVAVAVSLVLGAVAPPNASFEERGYVAGKLAFAPAVFVFLVVGVRMWLESRKIGKPKTF